MTSFNEPTIVVSISNRGGRLAQGVRLVFAGFLLLWGCRSQVPSSRPLGGIEYDVALAPAEAAKTTPKADVVAPAKRIAEPLSTPDEPEGPSETIPVVSSAPSGVSAAPSTAPHYAFRPLAKGWVMIEESHFIFDMKISMAGSNRPPMAMSATAERKSLLEVQALDGGAPAQFDISHSEARVVTTGMGTANTKPEETNGKRYSVQMRGAVPDVRTASGSRPPDAEEREISAEALGFEALYRLANAADGAPILKGQRLQLNPEVFKKMFGSTENMKISRAEATVEEVGVHDGKDAVRASVQFEFSVGEGGFDLEAQMKGDAWVDSASLRLLDIMLKGHGKPSSKSMPEGARVDVDADLEVSAHYTYQEPALPEGRQKR